MLPLTCRGITLASTTLKPLQPLTTEGSYAYKVGNCEIRISEYQFAKVLICLVQNVPKSKVLRQIAFHYSHQKINIYFDSKEQLF